MNNGVDVLNLEHSADWIVKQLGLQSFEHLLQKPKSDAEYLKKPEALQSQDMRGQYQLGTSYQSQKMTQDVSQQRISEIDGSDSTKPSLSFEQIQEADNRENLCIVCQEHIFGIQSILVCEHDHRVHVGQCYSLLLQLYNTCPLCKTKFSEYI